MASKASTQALPKEIEVQTQHAVKTIKIRSPKGIRISLDFDSNGTLEDIPEIIGMSDDLTTDFFDEIIVMKEDNFRDFVKCLAVIRDEHAKIRALGAPMLTNVFAPAPKL